MRDGLAALATARRPAVLVGDPPGRDARDALIRLLDLTGMPCFTGYEAIGLLDDDDERYGGTLFQLARLPATARPDVALLLGVRLGFETPGLRDGGRAWGTRLVQVDGDPAELGRFGPVAVGVAADPDSAALAFAAEAGSATWSVDRHWREAVRGSLTATRASLDELGESDGERLHPYHAAAAVSEAAARAGAPIVGDGAVCKHWLHDAAPPPGRGPLPDPRPVRLHGHRRRDGDRRGVRPSRLAGDRRDR